MKQRPASSIPEVGTGTRGTRDGFKLESEIFSSGVGSSHGLSSVPTAVRCGVKIDLLLCAAVTSLLLGCGKSESSLPPPVPPTPPVLPTSPPPPVIPAASVTPATPVVAAPAVPALPPTLPSVAVIPAAPTERQQALDTLQRVVEAVPGKPAVASVTPVATPTSSLADLSTDQVTRGLKEALGKGLEQAVGSLGKSGGFLTNLNVKIPLPERFQTVEKTLRSLGQDRVADEFVTTMNQAAEQAVPAAASVFKDSLQKMTMADAKKILAGSNNAATVYFRQSTQAELTQKFLPIVQKATASSGATAAYKQVTDKVKLAGPFVRVPELDLDGYVTEKALDGLFKQVAAEEQRIRQMPAARTTELLKSVFGFGK